MNINAQQLNFTDLDTKSVGQKFADHIQSLSLDADIVIDLRRCYLDYDACSIVFETLLKKLAAAFPANVKKKVTIQTHVDLGSADEMAAKLMRRSELLYDPLTYDRKRLTDYCTQINAEVFVEVLSPKNASATPAIKYFLNGA